MPHSLPTIALFVEGTFLPSREGATGRFLGVARNLTALGHKIVVIHCYRGWSDLDLISSERFATYAVTPDIYYRDLSRISNILASECVDIIQFFEIETLAGIGLPLARFLKTPRLAYECHDIHSEFLKSINAPENKVETVTRLECYALPICDLVTCFTLEDKRALLECGAAPECTFIVPFGTELRDAKINGRSAAGRNVVFLGNLYHRPNQSAVRFIVEELAPSLQRKNSACSFAIVGDYPPRLAKEFCNPDVTYIGAVERVADVLSGMALAVAPVTEGSGIKVKMLDYFAAGLPVVGTSLAFRGYPKAGGLVIDDLGAMPHAIATLLADSRQLGLMSAQARAIAEMHDWKQIGASLSNIYAQALDRAPRSTEWRLTGDLPHLNGGRPYVLDDNIGQARFANSTYPRLIESSVQRIGGGTQK